MAHCNTSNQRVVATNIIDQKPFEKHFKILSQSEGVIKNYNMYIFKCVDPYLDLSCNQFYSHFFIWGTQSNQSRWGSIKFHIHEPTRFSSQQRIFQSLEAPRRGPLKFLLHSICMQKFDRFRLTGTAHPAHNFDIRLKIVIGNYSWGVLLHWPTISKR